MNSPVLDVPPTHSTLAGINSLISEARDTGSGYYVCARSYPSGDAEVCAIRMTEEDSMRRGGGARREHDDKQFMDPAVLEKSARRAKTTVRRKILTMQADRLMTLTFRENLEDIDKAWSRYHYFNKLMRLKFPKFQYVCVPEYQKRGAVHFHLAIRGFYPVKAVRKIWRRAAGGFGGNIDITKPRKGCDWNPSAIAGYLSKYLTKHETVDFNRRRYSSGGSIQVPPASNGWLAIHMDKGLTFSTLEDVLSGLSQKDVRCFYESEHWLGIIYLST